MLWGATLVAAVFACLAYAGLLASRAVCARIVPFEDGPRVGKPPAAVLVAGGALLGFAVSYHGATWPELAMAATLDFVLVAAWASDVLCGIIPDYFTLIPLAGVSAAQIAGRHWEFVLSAVTVGFPFAVLALLSKGRGMGWGDVKLAALGGAVLGSYLAMYAFLVASVLAVVVAWLRGRRREPIAFGPYLAGAIGVALATGFRDL